MRQCRKKPFIEPPHRQVRRYFYVPGKKDFMKLLIRRAGESRQTAGIVQPGEAK
jgi:hypothetical protein